MDGEQQSAGDERRHLPPLEPDLQRVVDNLLDVVIRMRGDRFEWVSSSVEPALGWRPEHFLTMTPDLLVHPDDLLWVDRGFEESFATGAAVTTEMRLRCADASWAWMSASTRVIGSHPSGPERIIVLRRVDEEVELREQLRRSREQWVSVFEHAPIGMAVCDALGRFQYVNRSACVLLGRDERDLVGHTWQQFTLPEQAVTELELRAMAERDGYDRYSIRKEVVRPSGEHRTAEVEVSLLRDVEGRVDRQVRQMVDMTVLSATMQALAESQDRYRLLAANAADVVAIGSDHGVLEWVSEAAEHTTGWRPSDLVGRPFAELIHEDDRPLIEVAHEHLRHDQPSVFRARLHRVDGSWQWFEFRVRPVVGLDGVPVRIAAWRDVHAEVEAQQAAERSRSQFTAMFRHHDATMLLVEPDSGAILDANDAAARFYGYAVDELRAMHIDELNVLPAEEVRALRRSAIEQDRNTFVFPHRLASGDVRQVEVQSSPITDEGRTVLFSIVRDVTDLFEARQILQASEERHRLSNLRAPVAMLTLSLDTVVLDANTAAEALFGASSRELCGQRFADLVAAADRALLPTVGTLLNDTVTQEREVRVATANGATPWVLARLSLIRHDDQHLSHIIAQLVDVNQFVERQKSLAHQALHDPLTGLANRQLFFENLGHEIRRARRHGSPLAVLFCDIDHFKQINDTRGHHVGDVVLRAVGLRLALTARSNDRVARLGGDEFAILPDDVGGVDDITELAERVRQRLGRPIELGSGRSIAVTTSVGAVVVTGGGELGLDLDPESVLRHADAAMYQAKREGRDRSVVVRVD